MAVLTLIRHGQASFDGPVYDVLSPLGARQAEHLGAHLAHPARRPDVIYCGPAARHRDTARHLLLGMESAADPSATLPELPLLLAPLPALDEYPAEAVVRGCLPQLRAAHPEVEAWFSPERGADREAGGDPLTDRRAFEHIFRLAMARWLRGEADLPDVESFAAFAGRVRAALQQIMAQEGPRRRVAVVTSAGPVAVGAQLGLALPSGEGGPADAVALRLSWVVANASLTELRYRPGEVGLISFNATPHLAAPELITYR